MPSARESRIATLLRSHAIFEGASSRHLGVLAAESALHEHRPEALIISAGEPAQTVFALCGGQVRVFHRGPQGQQIVAKLFGAPAVFGEGEALARVPWIVSVQAVQPVEVVAMPTGAFLRFLAQEPRSAVRMVLDLGIRLAIASDHERSLAFDPATIRLANYLLDYGSWTNGPDEAYWQLALTQEQMAAAVGLTRRSVSKDVRAWQDEGILVRTRLGYEVRDRDALRRYANNDRLSLSYCVAESLAALEE